jgi:cyclic-di-GMP phosphodiesterase TipF (flagellum assembly factor)
VVSANSAGADRIQAVVGEINELGVLVKQLAVSVAGHDDMLSSGVPAATAPAPASDPDSDRLNDLPPEDSEKAAATAAPAPVPSAPAAAAVTSEAAPSRSHAQILAAVRAAVEENRIDIYLQPMVTLPQRKVRFYEAVTRLRDGKDQVLAADDFIAIAEAAGLIGRIDHMVMLRCVQVLRRLMVRNKDVGVFCNVAAATLGNPTTFTQCLDFLEANRALAPSFVLEFKQATFRNLGPAESENLAALAQRGYRFSIDHVTDLRIEPRELADRGVRFIKVPAALLLDQRQSSASDIHPSDLSDLLGRFGIDLIAERIEGERAVVDLLDFDVRFGQGFLFAPPRPLRPEGASATGGASPDKAQEPNGPGNKAPLNQPAIEPPPRTSGNAALARRAAGPG